MPHFKKILLTGANGQVGHALKHKLLAVTDEEYPSELFALSREQLDLSKPDDIRRIIRDIKPDLIINPAAYTAVDKAESEPELAFAINATAPRVLAEEAARRNALFVHYSTDYVFDGHKPSPYLEDDETNPLSVYGKTKLAGEQAICKVDAAHFVFRTSWVYGVHGKNFFNTILRLASERDALRIVGDQFGAPTSSLCIANATINVLNSARVKNQDDVFGIYHMTNAGRTSWHGFATEIITQYAQYALKHDLTALKTPIEHVAAITTLEYPTPAIRPSNSSLDLNKLNQAFNTTLTTWQLGLAEVLNTRNCQQLSFL